MTIQSVCEGVYLVPRAMVNIFLISDGSDLVLVDAGMAGDDKLILEAIAELGKRPADLKAILVTHLHIDHTGGLAAVQRVSGAPVYVHAADATLLRQGIASRKLEPSPGWLNRLFCRITLRSGEVAHVDPPTIEHEVADGEMLPLAGGIRAIHTPGHTAGHTVYLWDRHGGVLFGGDACSNLFGSIRFSFVYEDFALVGDAFRKIGGLSFNALCLAHGKPIATGADSLFRQKWNL